MKTGKISILLLSATLLLAGCQTTRNVGPGQAGGAILGSIGGAVVGSQIGSGRGSIAAAAAGAVIGGLIGSEIGAQLDANERRARDAAIQRALHAPTGATQHWGSPRRNYGYVTPTTNYYSYSGKRCRNAQMEAYIGGRKHLVNQRVCQRPDGYWEAY